MPAASGDVAPTLARPQPVPQDSVRIQDAQRVADPDRTVVEGRRLAAVPAGEPDGPHVRLGAVWAVSLFIATAAGAIPLALLYAATAALGALQASRSWKTRPREPALQLAVAGAALLPLAAAFGLPVLVGAAVATTVGALAYRPDPKRSAPALTLLVALGLGLAAASPVILRRTGLVEVLVLLSLVGVYDASAYLVGTGASRPWEGPAAGIAFMFAVSLAAAAIFVPPFSGVAPWLLGALAAALAPFGPRAAAQLVGDPRARVPALKRLDSLLLLGPIWTAAALALV